MVTGAGFLSAIAASLPTVNQRHLVVGTYEQNGFVRLYIDGALAASSGPFSNAINVSPTPAAIGNKPGANFGGDQFAGTIDEVSIHSIAMDGRPGSAGLGGGHRRARCIGPRVAGRIADSHRAGHRRRAR